MSQEKNELIKTITKIYHKNISFLQKRHPDIFTQVQEFENTKLEEKYYIDFDNNHFELYNIDGTKYYNCDPFIDAQIRVKNLDKDISGISTILTNKIDLGKDTPYDAKKFLNSYIEQIEGKVPNIPRYEKFIFLGTYLGVHLNEIDSHQKAKAYLILENSIEVFRLSLFLTDYEQIASNSKLFFSIAKKEEGFNNTVKEFIEYKSIYNAFIKFEIVSVSYVELFEQCTNIISSSNKMVYPFSEYIENYENNIQNFNYIKNGILNLSLKKKILGDLPIFFIASGPSLKNDIDFIKKNSKYFIIISVLSSLKRLELADIIPDIIISIDGNYHVKSSLSHNPKYYENSLFLASTSTNYQLLKEIDVPNLYLFQSGFSLFDSIGNVSGISVGDNAINLILSLGAKEIYMAGFDVCLDQTTGQTNDDTHITKDIVDLQSTDKSNYNYRDAIIEVKGNFTKKVKTTIYFNMILNSFNVIIKNYPKSVIYNLSNGAYLNHTKPIKPNNINISTLKSIDKQFFQNKLSKEFQLISKTKRNKKDIISHNLEEKIVSNFNEYKDNKNILDSSLVGQIINYFYELVEPYIHFIENNIDNKLKKELDKIKETQLSIILSTLKNLY